MAITNWQDPQTSEIRSTHISGLQDMVGKLEDSIGMDTVAEAGIELTEVYISAEDRYRIYQAPAGKRNWVASPAPVIKKNGDVITEGFTIDYAGGAIIVSPSAISTDVFTADVTYVAAMGTSFKSHEAETASQAHLGKNIGIEDTANNFTATDVEGALAELFTSGNEGKTLLETTLISKNAVVSKVGDVATFAELKDGILQLKDAPTITYFYSEGDEYVDATGGWVAGFSLRDGSQSKQADHLYLYTSGNGTEGGIRSYETTLKIDLTDINTLEIDWEFQSSVSGFGTRIFGLASTVGENIYLATTKISDDTYGRKISDLDVSSVTGLWYLVARCASGSLTTDNSILKIYAVRGTL